MGGSSDNVESHEGDNSSAKNLNLIMKDFLSWQETVMKLVDERSTLTQRIEDLELEKSTFSQKDGQRKEELYQYQVQINTLQDLLNRRCNYEAENRILKETVQNNHLKAEEKIKLREDDWVKLKDEMAAIVSVHAIEVKKLNENLHLQAMATKKEMKDASARKQKEIDNTKLVIDNLHKEREDQISQLKLEFDKKLHQVQKQVIKAQQPMPSTTAQEIFRKKLQDTKQGYELEIVRLQEKIALLEGNHQKQEGNLQGPTQKRRKLMNLHNNNYYTSFNS